MSHIPQSTADAPPVESVCLNCRFGVGEDRACSLLKSGNQETLFSDGPCRLPERIQAGAQRLIERRYPFAKDQSEDLSSEVLLGVMKSARLLAPDKIHHFGTLKRRIAEVVRNGVIDVLRHHRLVTRLRCGACQHFGELASGQTGCRKELTVEEEEVLGHHPWSGSVLEANNDPRKLDPPCETFAWNRPDNQDLIEEALPGESGDLTPRQKTLQVLLKGIDRMAQEDMVGLKAASAMFWHHFGGRSVGRMADDHAVSDKTIKRQLAEGRRRLERILKDDLGIESLDDLQ